MRLLPLLLLTLAAPAQERDPGTGPEPSPVPISWELEFRYLTPRRIDVQLPGAGKPETFWYMVYTVINTGSTTQRFFPSFQLVTSELQVVDTDMGISPVVFKAIRERHKVTHKYLVHPTEAIGELASGEGNARESVAIWRGVDVDVNAFTIYVAGLSGEARLVKNPVYDPAKPETMKVRGGDGYEHEEVVNPRYFTLRKTLELRFRVPGSEATRGRAEPELERTRWIMR